MVRENWLNFRSYPHPNPDPGFLKDSSTLPDRIFFQNCLAYISGLNDQICMKFCNRCIRGQVSPHYILEAIYGVRIQIRFFMFHVISVSSTVWWTKTFSKNFEEWTNRQTSIERHVVYIDSFSGCVFLRREVWQRPPHRIHLLTLMIQLFI